MFRPLADDVRIIVGAYHQRVLGVKLQVRQRVGIAVDKNQILHIVIDADLPLCGTASLVPSYYRAVRRDVRCLQFDRSRTVQGDGIEDGIIQYVRPLEDDLSKLIADYIGTLIGISTAFPYEVDFTPYADRQRAAIGAFSVSDCPFVIIKFLICQRILNDDGIRPPTVTKAVVQLIADRGHRIW